ncbi:glycosyltransferase [Sphingomonas sp. H39-1-10]|uniref:glycosyltransferase family 4 protein n=1 Tax=Sphingomonas pollutisoli TaxID=3030829 RepID=UPI0023B93F87|nr:glycosyltransferase [Sphingomonas pollutisoli]MDF0487751.1 glycosyltransferase [Sphingomonas pollutisoli]
MPREAFSRVMPMLSKMTMKRSHGVLVTSALHRLISHGNAARDLKAWPEAAETYRAVLEQAPHLVHIWIQRGHALRECGDVGRATEAYEKARDLCPANADPHLHLGHIAKLRGDISAATKHYLDAARCVPPSTDAYAELRFLSMKGAKISIHQLRTLIEKPDSLPVPRNSSPPERATTLAVETDVLADDGTPPKTCVVFDVSDLISYFNHSRTPSGIQRVQLETLRSALGDASCDVRICAVHETREEWIEIPSAQFLDLCWLSSSGEEEEWTLAFTKLTVRLNIEPAFAFPRGALLINLGTSWWIPNYFMFVRKAKEQAGIRYLPFVHDMIPLVRSELCPPLLVRDFMAWIVSVLDHADCYLVNSLSTRNDLMKVSAYLERPISPDRIEVIRLDAIPGKVAEVGDRAALKSFGLQRGSYVLCVSTIEPRKNHVLAFEAWYRLIDRHGARQVPKLVCVGNSGWMNEPVHAYLKARPDLMAKVQIFSNVSDEELDQLYEGCLFTLYPSHYEGWGLPVTESLGHGKVPLCSKISSIPEAGGDLADYFSPDSRTELTEGIERLAFDPAYRRSREQNIVRHFRPRSWNDISGQILSSANRWLDADAPPDCTPPRAESGRYYSLGRTLAGRLWPGLRSTETFRSGSNWWGRDPWGCWTKPGGGALLFTVPDATQAYRVYFDLLGMPNVRCALRIDANGKEGLEEISLEPNESKWVSVEIPGQVASDLPIKLFLTCETFEDLSVAGDGGDRRRIAVGVRGFYICEANDANARMALLEAVTLSSVDNLSVNRPPAEFVSIQAYLQGSVPE